ncbi:hypothetical protein U1Q18_002278 [Sarracenia purpurea var. burkii]
MVSQDQGGGCLVQFTPYKHMEDHPIAEEIERNVVEANESHESWLKLCDVGITKELIRIGDIENAMLSDGFNGTRIKALGDRKALIAFPHTKLVIEGQHRKKVDWQRAGLEEGELHEEGNQQLVSRLVLRKATL